MFLLQTAFCVLCPAYSETKKEQNQTASVCLFELKIKSPDLKVERMNKMAISRGLGKGLDSVFEENSFGEKGGVTMLRISDIEPRKGQPRKNFDSEALSQLADSIASNGVIQPLIVRPAAGGYYEIIAGERRWRASKMAGLTEVPVVVMDSDDRKTSEISLIENIQREDLNPVEEALAYRSLLKDYNLTQDNLAQRVGKSRSAITNSLRLLELPEEVLKMLADASITAGHARALLGLIDKSETVKAAELAASKQLSVRDTEDLVRKLNAALSKKEIEKDEQKDEVNYIAELEKALRSKLGRKVKIFHGKRNKKIEIEFSDDNDLEKLLALLGAENLL